MTRTRKITALFSAAVVCLSFFALPAKAFIDPGKRQLVACTVSSGGTVTQIGNTCSGTGDGCTPNPCG